MKISLAMIVRNEEENIRKCINSVLNLIDEIIVVDTGSTDNTLSILREYPNISLYHFDWCDNFSAARNFSIEQATGDYILVLDADEYVTRGSRDELESVMLKQSIGRILVDSHFEKDNQELHSHSYVSRFFPREVRFTGAIHEQLVSDKPRTKMNIVVNHSGYYKKDKSKRNIPLLLKEVKENPGDSYYLFQLGKELRINQKYNEAYEFLMRSYALVKKRSSFFEELVVEIINCGKEIKAIKEVLIIIKENEEQLSLVTDFHFAKGLFYLDYCLYYSSNPYEYIHEIEKSFLKCLRLKNTNYTEYVQGTSSYLAAYNLAVYYEVTGNLSKALEFYEMSSNFGYELANKRLAIIGN